MKHIIFIFVILTAFISCKKEEPVVIQVNSLAEDLKLVIEKEGVQALQTCCEGCSCSQSIGWGADFSFPGDNFVRIRDDYYNLNLLIRYEIRTFGSGNEDSETRMVLYFP